MVLEFSKDCLSTLLTKLTKLFTSDEIPVSTTVWLIYSFIQSYRVLLIFLSKKKSNYCLFNQC